MELNIRLTVLVVETARLERRGVNDNVWDSLFVIYYEIEVKGESLELYNKDTYILK